MNEDFRVLPVKLSIDLDLVMSWGRHRPEVLPVKLSIDLDLVTNEVAQTWSFIGKTLRRS